MTAAAGDSGAPLPPIATSRSGLVPDSLGTATARGGRSPVKGRSRKEEADAYFSELLSFSLDRLNKEPELLDQESASLQSQIQAAVYRRYQVLIRVVDGFGEVVTGLDRMQDHLGTLTQGLPELVQACDEFSGTAKDIMAQRAGNRQLLTQQPTVVELLEVPSLMDTCVKNGNYEEALELQAFVAKLVILHSGIPVIKMLAAEVEEVTQSLQQTLLEKLSSGVQLHDCLRLTGFLRRLGSFSEQELSQQFLQCRDTWLSGLVAEAAGQPPAELLRSLTDLHRLHLFDIIMQFRALFADSSGDLPRSDGGGSAAVLYGWAQYRMDLYLKAIKTNLPLISDGASLASVLESCLYCGNSLARVGLDARSLLPPVFEAATHALFVRNMAAACDALDSALAGHRWVSLPLSSLRQPRHGGAADGGGSEDVAGGGMNEVALQLMEHAPLAAFCSAILAAFNELRPLASLHLGEQLGRMVGMVLEHAANCLAQYSIMHPLQGNERQLFLDACRCLETLLAPYIVKCFSRIYPSAAAAVDIPAALVPLQELLAEAATAAAAAASGAAPASAAGSTPARRTPSTATTASTAVPAPGGASNTTPARPQATAAASGAAGE